MNQSTDLLVEELVLGSPRGGRREAEPLTFDVVRSLTAEDVPALLTNGGQGNDHSTLKIKAVHHNIAQLLARGTKQEEISLHTGLSPSYISVIKGAPAMQELIKHYEVQAEIQFADVLARIKMLGLSAAEELQERINAEPEKWSKRELMDLVELGILKPLAAAAQAKSGGGGAKVDISVQFVKAPARAEIGHGTVIEAQVGEEDEF